MKTEKGTRRKINRYRSWDPLLWKKGDPLTREDEELLSVLVEKYEELGYTPSKNEVPNSSSIKQRFRVWSDAVLAAGLPKYNDPDQMRIRTRKKQKEAKERKEFQQKRTDTDAHKQ